MPHSQRGGGTIEERVPPAIERALCDKVIEHAGKARSPHSALVLFHLEGALNERAGEHSPVGNRDARYVFNVQGSWEHPSDDTANIEWARDAWNDMKAFSTGGTYINFLTSDDGTERVRAALGTGLARLTDIKAKWDPQNVFRTNRNIHPGCLSG